MAQPHTLHELLDLVDQLQHAEGDYLRARNERRPGAARRHLMRLNDLRSRLRHAVKDTLATVAWVYDRPQNPISTDEAASTPGEEPARC
jgi:uncharacterized protein with von Willebrand factor type A (vWA) domain